MLIYSFDSDVSLLRNPQKGKVTKTVMPLSQAMEKMQKMGYSISDYIPDEKGFTMEYENPKTKTTYTIILSN